MKTNKILAGGIAGGVAFFLIGWVLYGMIFMSVMQDSCPMPQEIQDQMSKEPMVYWAMFVSNLMLAFLISFIFSLRGTVPSLGKAFGIGALIGALMSASFNFSLFSMSNWITLSGVFADIGIFGLMCALGATVIAWVMGMIKS